MKIVIAPDKFKGTLSAAEVASAIEKGIRGAAYRSSFTDISITSVPMADGGEGSIAALLSAKGGECISVPSFDALMRPVKSYWGLFHENGIRQAAAEAALSIGLYRLSKGERNPLLTTSFGYGSDIKRAIEAGCRQITAALGGTATSDCGAGMLSALGCRFYDKTGRLLPQPAGGDLERIHIIDTTLLNTLTAECRFTVLNDVDNPLLGDNGAAATFSFQKGADKEAAAILEAGAAHFASIAANTTGCSYEARKGSGAAGGIGWALNTFCKAEMTPGANFLGNACGLPDRIRDASLVVTGEGRFDGQSLHGKVVGYVASVAAKNGIPVVALCGTRDKSISQESFKEAGISNLYALTDRISLPKAFNCASAELTRMAEDIFGFLFN